MTQFWKSQHWSQNASRSILVHNLLWRKVSPTVVTLPPHYISSGALWEENTSTSTESAMAKWDKAREVQALCYTLASQAHNSWLGIINRGLSLPSSKRTPLSSSHCRGTAHHSSTSLVHVALARVDAKDFRGVASNDQIKTTTVDVKMRQQVNLLDKLHIHGKCVTLKCTQIPPTA